MDKKAEVAEAVAVPLTREQIRDQLLGHAPKASTKALTLFGIDVELRQPTLGAILDAQETESNRERSAAMIIQYAFVPGTDERVFEPADREMILKWPFNEDVIALQEAIIELSGVDIEGAEVELSGDPLDEPSSSTASK